MIICDVFRCYQVPSTQRALQSRDGDVISHRKVVYRACAIYGNFVISRIFTKMLLLLNLNVPVWIAALADITYKPRVDGHSG